MVNKKYNSGRRLEYKIINFLRKQGYYCIRSAGSHGAIDILAGNGEQLLAIQAKKRKNITKKEKEELKKSADLLQAHAVIVDKDLQFIYDF